VGGLPLVFALLCLPFLHDCLSRLFNFQEVRPSDFDIRWWIRYLHEYQEDGCEDFTSAVDAMRASPGIFFCLSLSLPSLYHRHIYLFFQLTLPSPGAPFATRRYDR
jgi:hypothetical protein